MKPTDKQLKAIDCILSIIETWKNTNDITSPTHFVDIEEFTQADLMDEIDDSIMFDIQDDLSSLLRTINEIEC